MPEGHTVHRIARDHIKDLGGQHLRVTSPQGRFEAGARRIDGRVLRSVDAWGKHLFYRFDDDETALHIHLGLYGKFWRHPAPGGATHRQVRIRMDGEVVGFDLTGPTACELMDPDVAQAVVDRLGPDPIRRGADGDRAWVKVAKRKAPIGVVVMDQSVVAGVGNVYRAETLFLHGLHPERPSSSLGHGEWTALWDTIVRLMRDGVRARRIVTVDRHDPCVDDGRQRYVYKQLHCARCGTGVRRWDLAGRWAYACEHCQPPWTG